MTLKQFAGICDSRQKKLGDNFSPNFPAYTLLKLFTFLEPATELGGICSRLTPRNLLIPIHRPCYSNNLGVSIP
jgi:hypothetical protein